MTEFVPFPKIPRLYREIVITEKIDGTNACVVIEDDRVHAQSRNRVITPDDDNYGFARWVQRNAPALIVTLGDGYHYGEWWGAGIQRRYGLTGEDKRFSLFNVGRWGATDFSDVPGLGVVPVLYEGAFDTYEVDICLEELEFNGSKASPGFMDPEGVVIFHTASREMFKATVKNDEKPKGQVAA